MKLLRQLTIVLVLSLTLIAANGRAQGTIEAINPIAVSNGYPPAQAGFLADTTVGWVFTPSQGIVITSLGFLGGTVNSSVVGTSAGLWSMDGTLLRSVNFDGMATTINNTLYETIDPISVAAGTPLVIALGRHSETYVEMIFASGDMVQNPLTFGGIAELDGRGFGFPTQYSQVDEDHNLAGAATFLFQPVPEPGSCVMLLGGMVALGIIWKGQKLPRKAKPVSYTG